MKSIRLSISLRAPLHSWLAKRAKDRGRSIGAEIRDALERFSDAQLKEGLKNMENAGKPRG